MLTCKTLFSLINSFAVHIYKRRYIPYLGYMNCVFITTFALEHYRLILYARTYKHMQFRGVGGGGVGGGGLHFDYVKCYLRDQWKWIS